MKAENLSVSVKRACQTTISTGGGHPWRNRLKTLEVSRRDQVWVGDITYVRLKARFVYVSLLMDVFTRMIRGDRQVSQHLTQPLTLKPLEEALRQSVPEIHHSDQGVQYLSSTYVSTLRRHNIKISVARRGRPWENGYAERLIRTRKEEEVHLNDYKNVMEARDRIGHFITQVYNKKRPHSALGYLTPVEFQQQNLEPNFSNFRSKLTLALHLYVQGPCNEMNIQEYAMFQKGEMIRSWTPITTKRIKNVITNWFQNVRQQ